MSVNDVVEPWFVKARSDLHSAEVLLAAEEYDNAAYFCQQAAEKSLKGFLVNCGVEPPRIHSLFDLTDLCTKYDAEFAKISMQCVCLTQYAVEVRYPDAGISVKKEDVDIALVYADDIYQFCKSKLNLTSEK